MRPFTTFCLAICGFISAASANDWPTAREPESPYPSRIIESARSRAEQDRRWAATLPPTVSDLAEANADFAERWADVAEAWRTVSERVNEADQKLVLTTRDFEQMGQKIAEFGLTPTIGILLRNKKDQLAREQTQVSETLFVSQELGRTRQQQLELEMMRYDGSDLVGQTNQLLDEAGLQRDRFADASMIRRVNDCLRQRRDWIEALRRGYQDYQNQLGRLDSVTSATSVVNQDYRALIDRNIIWIRSGEPISLTDLGRIRSGIGALFSSRRSGEIGWTIEKKWQSGPGSCIGLLILVVSIWLVRWRAKVGLLAIGQRKRLRDTSPDFRKAAASFLTVLVAVCFPINLYLIGRWLGTGVVTESSLASANGFYASALVAWMVEAPRQVLRQFGYVDQHVEVELPRRDRATTYLTLIGFGLVLAAYVITVSGLIDHGMWRDSVSRFGFMTAMMLVAWTAHLSLRPTGGFLEPLIQRFGGAVIYRVRWVLYLVAIGFPMTMTMASALGYEFTANEAIGRTIWTVAGLTMAATLWGGVKIIAAATWRLLVSQRPASDPSDTLRRKKSSRIDRFGDAEIGRLSDTQEVAGVLGEHFLELKHQIAFLCQCGLVITAIVGIGWLWVDMFPNARVGNPIVWTVQDTVSRSVADANGDMVLGTFVETTPVTVMNLVLAAATLFVAFQIAKLLPALFDALVLQRVSFDEAMEHFSLVLGRFLLFGIGCFIACKWVGIRWQTIQWLAVGLTIGLGFGLQDLVRNLFGGLIVLFEKPARLGDFITVGDVTGRVAAQRLRTTVVSDDEGREVIIPNKNFVSHDVINWMGAGRISVIPIEVAVTREERPADICRRLQELVIAQDDILLTPAPQATLVCVGKRTQRIEVRAWIEDRHDAPRFRDELLKIARHFLHNEGLLAHDQPTQSDMLDQRSRPRKRAA